MGEKGNAVAGLGADLAGDASLQIVERTTTTATTAVTNLGQDLAETIREKSIGAAADGAVDAGRERLRRDDTAPGAADPLTS